MCVCICDSAHTDRHRHTDRHTHTYGCTTYTRTHLRVHVHTHIHTYMSMCTHTHTRTYTCTWTHHTPHICEINPVQYGDSHDFIPDKICFQLLYLVIIYMLELLTLLGSDFRHGRMYMDAPHILSTFICYIKWERPCQKCR